MQKKLTKLQAYNAFVKLLKIYYYLDSSGDIGMIIGCMSFLRDKKTVDNAMWEFWEESLCKSLKSKNLRDYNHLTVLQAFIACGFFLEEYFGRNNLAKDIDFLQCNMELASHKKLIDHVLWENWLRCVNEVLSMNDSREYFYLNSK